MEGVSRNLSVFLIDDGVVEVELTVLALAELTPSPDVPTCPGGACPGNQEVLRTLEELGPALPDLFLLDIQMPPSRASPS